MKMRVGAEGFGAAAEALGNVASGMGEATAAGLAEGLAAMAENARENVPVRSGRLQASIGSEAQATGEGAAGALYAGTPYAALVELGGASTPAQPFLYPAAEAGLEALRAGVLGWIVDGGD